MGKVLVGDGDRTGRVELGADGYEYLCLSFETERRPRKPISTRRTSFKPTITTIEMEMTITFVDPELFRIFEENQRALDEALSRFVEEQLRSQLLRAIASKPT